MLNLEVEDLRKLEQHPLEDIDKMGVNAKVILKIHNPFGKGSWYILGAEKMHDGKDYLCFGYVDSWISPVCSEYGYFTLKELAERQFPLYATDGEYEIFLGYGGLEVDRDFKDESSIGEIVKKLKERYENE